MRELDEVEKQALIQHAKEELRALKLPKAEIQDLEDKGEIVSYYGNFLSYRALQPPVKTERKRKATRSERQGK